MSVHPLRRTFAIIATWALCVGPAFASPRLEVVDDTLWDHETGLVWQHVEATLGLTLPTDARVGEWRVATGNELFGLLGAPSDETIARDSDRYFALSFFSMGRPCVVADYEGCFGGWWHDASGTLPTNPAFYNVGGFNWKTIPGDPEHVLLNSGFSLGSYTEERCGIFCNAPRSMYTVRAIPEPASGVLIMLGLVALSRRAKRRPY